MTESNRIVLELVKIFAGHAYKTEFWYLLGVLFKIYDDHPHHFLKGSSPPVEN